MLEGLSVIFRRRRVVTEREVRYAKQFKLLADTTTQADGAYSRLLGYIPGDVVGLYLMAVGVFGGTIVNVPGHTSSGQPAAATQSGLLWIVYVVLLLLAPFLAFVGTLRPRVPTWRERVQWFQVCSSPFAFTAWAFAVGGPFASLSFWSGPIGALALAVVSTMIVALDRLFDFLTKETGSSKPNPPAA